MLRVFFFALLALLVAVPFVAAQPLTPPQKNVLVLHEGSRLLPYQIETSREIEKALTADRSLSIELYEEYLDRWRLGRDEATIAAALETKYAEMKFDVVVADGAAGYWLLQKNPPPFLRGTPVVFLAIADPLPKDPLANATGVVSKVDVLGTVQLAARLQPDLRHLYYIVSDGAWDEALSKRIREALRPLGDQLEITVWEQQPLEEMVKKAAHLPAHSAVLFDAFFKDATGRTYVPAMAGAQIAKSSNAPVYSMYDTLVGVGPVGGVVINFSEIGRQASAMVLSLLHGATISNIPIEFSRNETMVDWRALQRFGLSKDLLPASAIVLYREPNLWEHYRWYMVGTIGVILLQAILLFTLAREGRKRKQSERSLQELAGRLIRAQEEERRRIAGELHDDVSQRLALLCVRLDLMRQSLPLSNARLVADLSVLYDETDSITTDIHQFSHELHPAILERIGLIRALRRHCKEFTAHRKIEVNLQVSGEESGLTPETALALYRVAQECLMNIAKHSGANCCDVLLDYGQEQVVLEIQDLGRGFDAGDESAEGLGLVSMRERLRSVGGTFQISSALIGGTKVRAEIPVTKVQVEPLAVEIEKLTAARPAA